MSEKGMVVADIIDAVAGGRIGHGEAIQRLGLKSYPELLDTMHANGRIPWAHRRPATLNPTTLEILRLATTPPAPPSTRR